jgi:hypothetical protein
MKKLSFLLVAISIQLYAAENATNFTKSIVKSFSQIWINTPQEKVYLHIDKPYYSAGEEIWFKAYLTNAATHEMNTKSKFVYVELIDKSDSVLYRLKIRKDSLGFFGNIKLNPELQAGIYSLRAYTYWMQNLSDDFYFKRNIYIGNSIDDRVKCQINYGSLIKNNLPVNLLFTNTYNNPLSQKNVTIIQSWLKTRNKITAKTNEKGQINILLNIDSLQTVKKTLSISIKESGINFKHKIYVPSFINDFDVQFFPESGTFLNNDFQQIGFKAIGKNGLSIDVNGEIFNKNNELITDFKSTHNGMGKFFLVTEPGENYYAIVKSADGIEKRFELPKTQVQGIALHIAYNRGKIALQIINKSNISTDSLVLLVHNRGIVYLVNSIKNAEFQINESLLPAGICTFSIIDLNKNYYCERLFFSRNFEDPQFKMTSDKNFYGKREAVKLGFQITDIEGKALKGNYSVSITDSKAVSNDTLSENIKSYLLLSSDIKGYIEKPAEYFLDNSLASREKLDLLLLTQGWKRFNTANILKNKFPKLEYYLEAGQVVSGKVLNLFGKPSKNRDVILLSSYKTGFRMAKTDSLGNFLFDGIEFPDSTQILLKAISKTKIVDVEIINDSDVFKKPNTFIPFENKKNEVAEEYFQIIKEKYYTEGGMLMINLEELTVKADAKTKAEDNIYASSADNSISGENLQNMPGNDVLDILRTIVGVNVIGEEIRIRGNNGPPMIQIDGFETENMSDLTMLSKFDIEGIYVYKGASAAIFGFRGGNGVIQITLKKGVVRKTVTAPSLIRIQPLGYQKNIEFYVPKYDVERNRENPKPDLRTTIYWNPKLKTTDDGLLNFEFYTADKANNYNIEIEGIGENGEICRYKGILRRE